MADLDLTTASALFKSKYGDRSREAYNIASPTLSQLTVKDDFVGSDWIENMPLSFYGGSGSGTIPYGNPGKEGKVLYTRKKVYTVCSVDREAIKAASSDEGAFIKLTAHNSKMTVRSFNRNRHRILFSDGTGKLGTLNGAASLSGTGSVADPYVCIISSATWKEANFEENEFVNIDSESTLLYVSEVTPSTRTVKLVGSSATLAAATGGGSSTAVIYQQGSKDNDPSGFASVLKATSGTLYNIAIQRRWQAYQASDSNVTISPDVLHDDILNMHNKTGLQPNLVVTGLTQYKRLGNVIEDQKRYPILPKGVPEEIGMKLGWTAMHVLGPDGPIPVIYDRFCDADAVLYLNTDYIKEHHAPGGAEWFSEGQGGTIFYNKMDRTDGFEARYGAYYENYIIPTFQGIRWNLTT